MVSHGTNEDPDHPTASVGEPTYKVRWYSQDRDGDTYELIRHIPRNKIVSYYKRIKEPLPENLDQAQMGYDTYYHSNLIGNNLSILHVPLLHTNLVS